jgi:2-polyprenyl-3-methyl-5-hydroxy-6-metoxy-1,4-benzoquinol methylase
MTTEVYGGYDIFESPVCPVCSVDENQTLYRRNKRTGSTLGEIEIVVAQCSGCGFVYNCPRVRQSILSNYYYSSSVASGQTYRDEGPHGYYPLLHKARARFFSGFLKKQPSGKLLDVGCGVGGFLQAVSAEIIGDWQLLGLEPSMEASKQARANGYTVETAILAEDVFSPSSFDAISLVSVLEHLPDLHQAIKSVSILLKPDGIVFIEVPNLLSPELTLTGFFSLEHIQHFTPGSLSALLIQYGLSEIVVDPNVKDKIIRITASSNMARWSDADLMTFVDDTLAARAAVTEYASKEDRLLSKLNRKVSDAFIRWRQQGLTTAIYGAGTHTAELMAHFDLHSVSSILLDGDPKKQGTTFLDLPVYSPEQIPKLGIDAILVSSNRFQAEIVRKIRQVAGNSIEVVLCYDE